MAYKKALLIPVSLATHTKFKHQAAQDGLSMSKVVRGLIGAYLRGEVSPVPKEQGASEPRHWAVYDELAAKIDEVLSE